MKKRGGKAGQRRKLTRDGREQQRIMKWGRGEVEIVLCVYERRQGCSLLATSRSNKPTLLTPLVHVCVCVLMVF